MDHVIQACANYLIYVRFVCMIGCIPNSKQRLKQAQETIGQVGENERVLQLIVYPIAAQIKHHNKSLNIFPSKLVSYGT